MATTLVVEFEKINKNCIDYKNIKFFDNLHFSTILDGKCDALLFLHFLSFLTDEYYLISPPLRFFTSTLKYIGKIYNKKVENVSNPIKRWVCAMKSLGIRVSLKKDEQTIIILKRKGKNFDKFFSYYSSLVRKNSVRDVILRSFSFLPNTLASELTLALDFHHSFDFSIEYKEHVRNILQNLRQNNELCESVKNYSTNIFTLPELSNDELATKDIKKLKEKLVNEAKFDAVRIEKEEAMTEEFRCPRCGKRKASFTQLQTRGADEPMTIFLHCLECGNRWRR